MNGITKEEWPGIVNKLKHSALPVPPSYVSDYDNWLCRSYAGRTLFAMEDYENALMVLATVLDVQPDLQDKPEEGFSQTEHKVLCLTDMVELIMGLANNPEAALRYQNEAVKLCENFRGEFRTADPMKIWQKKIELLRLAGKVEEAETAAKMGWQPKASLKKQELLDVTAVRHRKGQQGDSGFKTEEFLKGINDNLK